MTAPTRPLTARQEQALRLVAEGSDQKAVGRALGISRRGAGLLVEAAVQKLGAANVPQAVLLACRAGILDGRPLTRHGDHAGYEAHRKRRIPYCDACVEGEKAYRAGLKAAKSQEQPSEGLGGPRPSRTAPAP